jgi:hypothetical protein
MTPNHSTHPLVVSGVVVIASVMLFNTLFSILLLGSIWIAPPTETGIGLSYTETTLEDYFSGVRLLWCVGLAVLGTAGFWLWRLEQGDNG